jgi:hypothetical protein
VTTTVAPVTFGQLSVLRSLEPVAPEDLPRRNQLRLWRVPPGTSDETVHATLRLLAGRHEGLRTRFTGTSQIVDPGHGPDPEPQDATWTTHSDALERMRGLGRRGFALDREYGWRAQPLTGTDGTPGYVAVSLHHMLVDRYALDRLTREFNSLVRDGAAAVTGPARSVVELAEQQRGEGWATRRRRSMEYLRTILADDSRPRTAPPSGRIEVRRLSTAAAPHLAAASTALAVSAQAIMLALSALICAQLRGTGRPLIGLMASNRLIPAWQAMVTSMNQRTWAALDVTADTDFADLARRASLASLTAFRHGCYDVDELTRLSDEVGPMPAIDCSLNVMKQEPGINTPERPAPDGDTWVSPKVHGGAPVELKVFQGPQQRTNLRIDPRLCTPGDLLAVLDWCDARLARLAAGERPRVGEMRDSLC